MKLQTRAWLDRARGGLRKPLGALRAYRGWLECAAITAATAVALLAMGHSAEGRTALLEREAEQLQRVSTGIDGWARHLQPPTPEETLSWRRSEQRLSSLSGAGREPLVVARRLAARAEQMGIHDLRIQLAAAEGLEPPAPVETPHWTVRAGPTPVVVEFAGDWPLVLAFAAALPPEVEVGRMQVATDQGSLRARMLLFIREVTVKS